MNHYYDDAFYERINHHHEVASEALEVTCLADVRLRPIEWLWPNWIAIGKVSVLAGEGGKGKSTILCDLAARTTTGERWPDAAENGRPGDVLILAAEDDVEDTLAPRLMAAGANMRRIFTIRSVRSGAGRRTFNLQSDLERLEAEISMRGEVRLVSIDPVSSYLGKIDSHKNAEVRSVLEPLGEMAARMRVAIICNNHFSKSGGNANNRIIGSVAFVNQARAAFIVTPDADVEGRLLLMPSKMNIAPIKHGLAYRIDGCLVPDAEGMDVLTSRIGWELAPVTITADQALAAHDQATDSLTGGKLPTKAEAEEFLRDALADGPAPVTELQADAKAAGLSWATIRRAKDCLGVIAERESQGREGKGRWLWRVPSPPRCSRDPQDAHFQKVSALHQDERLADPEPDPLEIPAFLRRPLPGERQAPAITPALGPPGHNTLDDSDGGYSR
jgi:putative DNA primase/helicase